MAVQTLSAKYEDYVGSNVTGLKSQKYIIGTKIKQGGEGAIFEIKGNGDLVAKIYNYVDLSDISRSSKKERKLKVMISNPVTSAYTSEGQLLIAWPMDVIYLSGCFIGYIMPIVSGKQSYNYITNETLCSQHYPDVTWREKFVYAYNLSYAVKQVHNAGHIVGDMNPLNLLVGKDGVVTIIDTDSFTIIDKDTGETFPCEVGVAEYIAPEIQGSGRVSARKFTRETDNFALAVNIFRLLMGGYHPFTCTVKPTGKSTGQTPMETFIAEGICPFVKDISGHSIPAGAPSLSAMPEKIASMFRLVFNYTASTAIRNKSDRPSPDNWCVALYSVYANESNFKKHMCNSKTHVYYHSLSECPWCLAEKQRINPPVQTSESENVYVNSSSSGNVTSSPSSSPNSSNSYCNSSSSGSSRIGWSSYGGVSSTPNYSVFADPPTGKYNVGLVIWSLVSSLFFSILMLIPFGVLLFKAKNADTGTKQRKYEGAVKVINIIILVIYIIFIFVQLAFS